ncbi:ImmA/IrrE family metallo-endopeptidase, partial [Streptosporangium canum]|uniref:ImmA/IrrE family metallo-endopeptidase n=1 Tax=Streptosporangium canum TaxID=324952 RepID=UPI003431B3EA
WVVHDIVETFERHVEMPSRDVPTCPVSTVEESPFHPIEAAQELRTSWGIDKGPIAHLLRTAENHGIVVTFSPIQAASVDAYSFETPSRPIILLNPLKNDYYRQRFDLAHEIGHIVMHVDVEPGGRIPEQQANQFASELLMPADEIIEQLPSRINWPHLLSLKEYWGVSLQALLFRARELETLSDVTYRNALIRMSKEGWRRQEPGRHRTLEQPSLLPQSLSLLETIGTLPENIATEARVPMNLFTTITSREPGINKSVHIDISPRTTSDRPMDEAEVISLFENYV